MAGMTLTKQSEDVLNRRYNASGVIFIKTGDKEITSFEFYRARNGKLYIATTTKPEEVVTVLLEIANAIPEEII